MQCPRCSEMVPDESTDCPICLKPLSPYDRSNVRVSLTGDDYQSPELPVVAIHADVPEVSPRVESASPEDSPVTPLRLIPTRPDLFPAARRTMATSPVRARQDLARWTIVGLAVAGVIASAVLWHRPYVAPVHVVLGTAGQAEIDLNAGAERAIPAVYLWLWGCYGALAIATNILLPAPWRFGRFRIRTNWVLNVTTLLTLLVFLGANLGQRSDYAFGREAIVFREAGTYEYQHVNESRPVTAEEARQINERQIHDQEYAIFKQWNIAALLSYLALGMYAVWWIVVRPEADAVRPEHDDNWWLREIRGEPDPGTALDGSETLPSENARAREPAAGKIPWR